jgi:hypothetical protein
MTVVKTPRMAAGVYACNLNAGTFKPLIDISTCTCG